MWWNYTLTRMKYFSSEKKSGQYKDAGGSQDMQKSCIEWTYFDIDFLKSVKHLEEFET